MFDEYDLSVFKTKRYSQDEIEELCEILGIDPANQHQRDELWFDLEDEALYSSEMREYRDKYPNRSDQRNHVKKIAKLASDIKKHADELNEYTKLRLALKEQKMSADPLPSYLPARTIRKGKASLTKMLNAVEHLEKICAAVAEEEPKGKQKEIAFEEWANVLAQIYYVIKGRNPTITYKDDGENGGRYVGDFYEFALKAGSKLFPSETDSAFGKKLQRALYPRFKSSR